MESPYTTAGLSCRRPFDTHHFCPPVQKTCVKNLRDAWHPATLALASRQRAVSAGGSFPTPPTTSRRISHEQGFAYYTAPPRAHSRRSAHFLKPLPIAALAALLAAPAAWANDGGTTFTDYFGDSAYGGFGSGNTVIYDENRTVGDAYGGYSDKDSTDPKILDKTGKANGNTLTVTGTVDWAFGGTAKDTGGNAEANGNTLTVKGTVTYRAYGGYSYEGSATGNFVFIDGGTAVGATGGYTHGGDATGNTVTLISGQVTDSVLGGSCAGSGCNRVSNILAVQGKEFPVGQYVENFDTLNFTLPADIKHNDTMLSVGTYATFGEA
ncbi:MAG: hypothetical protein IJM64_00390, partial [Ottowia sp.]|nr:hypothetical protein [Ottowia sp.]